jgi:hypothetical protein
MFRLNKFRIDNHCGFATVIAQSSKVHLSAKIGLLLDFYSFEFCEGGDMELICLKVKSDCQK